MSFIRPSEPLQAALPLLISFSSDRAATLAARPPVPYTHLAAYEALLFVPFLVPPFPGRRALFLGLQTSLLLYLLRCTLGSPSVDYAYGVALYGQMQRFCDFYGCAGTPETNSDLIPKGQAGAFGDLRWWQKLHAVEGVYRNTRGIGWRWELRRRPMRTPLDRWRFVSRNFLWGMFLLAVSMPAQRMYAPAERLLGGIPVWERVLRSHAGIFGVFAFLDGVYAFSAAATVAAGVSRPTDWPPAFGELKECWSIRRTWGFWHQMLTRMVLSHSRFLAELLGVTRDKGRAFYLFHVYVAFLLSGLLHAVPAWVVSRTDGAAMAYFMLQAVGITFEVCFWRPVGKWLGLGEGMSPGVREPIANGIAKNPEDERRKSRKRALVKTMGFMWTVVWFSITNTVLIEGIVAVGMHPLPDFQGAPWWVRYVCTYWGRVI